MKENENIEPKTQKNKMAWLYTLFTVLVFAPTVVIIIILLVQNADGAVPSDTDKATSGSESIGENIPTILKEDYLELVKDAKNTAGLPEKYKDEEFVEVKDGDTVYKFYLSSDTVEGFFSTGGKYYEIDKTKLKSFYDKKNNIEGTANIPTMFLCGDKVYPVSAGFYFRTESGSVVNLSNSDNPATEKINSVNSFVLVSFDSAPDECTVTLYDGEKIVFSGTPQILSEYNFAGYESLTCHVYAKWKDTKKTIGGSATYRFEVVFGEAETKIPTEVGTDHLIPSAEFTLDSNVLAIGEYTVLRIKNVTDVSKIKLSCVPSLPYEPDIFKNGEEYCALIVVPMDAEIKTHLINIEFEGKVTTLTFGVNPRVYKEREYEASGSLIKISRSLKALEEYENIKEVINSMESYPIELTDSLGDYTKTVYNDSNIYLGFGYFRKLADGTKYRMDGVDYRLTEGSQIPSIARGKVIYTGYSQYLGYYVVVDHGGGIRTWYSHLSLVTVQENDIVSAGDSLGYAGRTGFTATCGVYVNCTINGVSVSPYRIIESGIFGYYGDNEYDEIVFG